MIGKIHVANDLLAQLLLHVIWDALDLGIKVHMLFHSHEREDGILLGAVADQFTNGLKLSHNVLFGYC